MNSSTSSSSSSSSFSSSSYGNLPVHLSEGEKLKILFRLTGISTVFDVFYSYLIQYFLVKAVDLPTNCNFNYEDPEATLSVCFERNGKFAVTRELNIRTDTELVSFNNATSSYSFSFDETLSLVSCLGLVPGRYRINLYHSLFPMLNEHLVNFKVISELSTDIKF
jgi:hypothetical protein